MNELQQAVNSTGSVLQSSLMFSASLGGKELFHSNFFAWLCRHYPKVGLTMLTGDADAGPLTVMTPRGDASADDSESATDVSAEDDALAALESENASALTRAAETIRREFRNFDLYMATCDGTRRYVIENKFKSSPDAEQLVEYAKKIPIDGSGYISLILLCVDAAEGSRAVATANERLNATERVWRYRTYDTLLNALEANSSASSISCSYHRLAIEDYIASTRALLGLAGEFTPTMSSKFLLPPAVVDALGDLRIHDLIEKRRAGALADMLTSRLASDANGHYAIFVQHRNSLKTGPKEMPASVQIYSGYSNRSAALGAHFVAEMGLKLPGRGQDYVWPIQVGVQLQAGQFRVYVSVGLDAHEDALRTKADGHAPYEILLSIARKLSERVSPPGCCIAHKHWKLRKQGNRRKLVEPDYRKGGKTFLYGLRFQYCQAPIDRDATTDQVLGAAASALKQLIDISRRSELWTNTGLDKRICRFTANV